MDQDRKVTPLKALQGMLWEAGYRRGDFTGHVYPDAALRLRRWHHAGIGLYVYSSGSVQAQRLLFGHSDAGDLTPLFSGYFDTTSGPKRAADSYRRIAARIGLPTAEILFLSDMIEELDAARAAGMRTMRLVRDRTPAANAPHPEVGDFSQIRLQAPGAA
jgi:enolase-phosphatase E1